MGKPKIRFEGYREDWEQRKLGEVLKLENGYAFKSQFFSDNETNIIVATPGNVSVDGGFIEEGGKYYKIDGEIPDAYIFHPGDLFVTMTDLTPTANTLGKPATVPDNGVMYLHNQRLGKLIGFEGDKAFLYSLLCTSEYHNYMVVTASGSTVRHSSPGRILEYEIAIPGLDEQIKIGKYFSNLDHLITLHQRKCDEIKTLKKYMLQKMFPQNGEKVPEIRFNGFTEDWEQRKLSDYLSVSGQKNRDEKYDKEDVLSVSGDYGIVNQIEFQGRSFAGASVTNYGVVETNDVVYTKSPLKANPYGIIKSNKGKPGIVSTLYAVYHPNDITDSEFVQVYFEQDARMNSYMHPLVNKGAKNDMKVSAENALKGEVIFPKLDEQRQISDYFRRLDTIITLHQRKCNELKEIKKYMLQNMFV